MKEHDLSRATLGRVPLYLDYVRSLPPDSAFVSATAVSRALGLGEVQVRKDLGVLCGDGRPRVGYCRAQLEEKLASYLDGRNGETIIVGAGKLGRALLDYDGFSLFGLNILAAFDTAVKDVEYTARGKPILPMEALPGFCRETGAKIGIIAVPASAAQGVCNLLYDNGVRAMWCFAPCQLYKPLDAVIQYENMALSLAHLKAQIDT